MCATCGCSETEHGGHEHAHPHEHGHDHGERTRVRLEREVLEKNNRLAAGVRQRLAERGILALNLVSAPGAGKTTVLERTIRELKATVATYVIEGDQETDRDAARIRAAGAAGAVQVNTGTGCHLDAEMVGRALERLDPPPGSLLFIENVGNLVCPALFDLGEQAKVVILSVTEGDDKPLKYPHMFRASQLMLLNKIDLLPHVAFDVEGCRTVARRVNPTLETLTLSATHGDGLAAWYTWLLEQRACCDGAAAASGRLHE